MQQFFGYCHQEDQDLEERFKKFKMNHDKYFQRKWKKCSKKSEHRSLPERSVVKILVSFKHKPYVAVGETYDLALELCLEKVEQGFIEYKNSVSLKKKRKRERYARINQFFKFLQKHKRA